MNTPTRTCWWIALPLAAMLTSGCGGGSDGGDASPAAYVSARSASFSPTTAKDAATGQTAVALHWVYAVNSGNAVSASLSGVTVGIAIGSAEVTLAPAALQRKVVLQGPLAASANGVAYSGDFSATIAEDLAFSSGKTVFNAQTTDLVLNLAGGGESARATMKAALTGFTPPCEWLPDRETLDQLPVGHVETVACSALSSVDIRITDEAPITRSNVTTAVSDRWTVLEKLASMTVRGKTYANVVRLSRATRVPDLSGNLVNVTITYWVAKGVGMIRSQGAYRVLNVADVVYELTDTNLSPP